MDERTAIASMTEVERRVRGAGDRWYALESLIFGACLAGLLIGQRALSQWDWRWHLGIVVVNGVAVAIHFWRRRVDRRPSRWVSGVWPATFLLMMVSVILLDAVVAPGLTLTAIAVATLPTLPGLTAVARTHVR